VLLAGVTLLMNLAERRQPPSRRQLTGADGRGALGWRYPSVARAATRAIRLGPIMRATDTSASAFRAVAVIEPSLLVRWRFI
jgi:hypothetical protein